jgi:hypothetical protein
MDGNLLMLFNTALKAKIPFIGVQYTDPVNFVAILQFIAGKPVFELPETKTYTVGDSYLYWCSDSKKVTPEMYKKLCNSGASCVVLNQAPNMLVYDAGVMPTPTKFLKDYLSPFVEEEQLAPLVQSLQGLSLKDAQCVAQLTMARAGAITPVEVRKTRLISGGHTPGLDTLSTEVGFYIMPKVVKDWVELNDKYFLDPKVPIKLVPRGLMAVGSSGVGKSTLAQVLAAHWKVPLFRLDVSAGLSKWQGESEGNFARNLAVLDANSPCVVLIDEVEKLFTKGADETAGRILSQLLWWLQNHSGRTLVVMTSNDLTSVPPEVYRAGRIDRVVEIQKLSLGEAKSFAVGVYASILEHPTTYKIGVMKDALEQTGKSQFAHAEVVEIVIELIKSKGWDAKVEVVNNS